MRIYNNAQKSQSLQEKRSPFKSLLVDHQFRLYKSDISFLYPIRSLYVEGANRRYHFADGLHNIFQIFSKINNKQFAIFKNISLNIKGFSKIFIIFYLYFIGYIVNI